MKTNYIFHNFKFSQLGKLNYVINLTNYLKTRDSFKVNLFYKLQLQKKSYENSLVSLALLNFPLLLQRFFLNFGLL